MIMMGLVVAITAFADDAQPGFVNCQFVDASGRTHEFFEKVPIVTVENLHRESTYPRPGIIRCSVTERRRGTDGRELICIDTAVPDGVESTRGETRFEVLAEQLKVEVVQR
jgi:hypothetical protein